MVDATQDADETTRILKAKAQGFLELNKVIHITFKNGAWKRGTVLSIKENYFIINERLDGEMPIFFLEISDIQLFTPKPKEGYANGF